MPRVLAALIAAVVLGGCSLAASAPTAVPPLAGVEAATVIGTHKTLTDHVVSFSTGKDCSTIRVQTGRTYCVEDEVAPPQEVYCYRTLGKVTCYAEPQPYPGRYQLLGQLPEGSRPPR